MPWLIGLNFYIALGAGTLTAASAVWLRGHAGGGEDPSPWAGAFVVTCGVLAVYNLGRIAVKLGETDTPGQADSRRRRWIDRQQTAICVVGFASLSGCCMGALAWLPPEAWLAIVAGGGIVTAYYGGAAWAKRKRLGLRSVPAVKPFTVGAAWAVATALLPAATLGVSANASWVWQLAAANGLFIAGLTLPFDIRDRRHDAQRGVSTLATVAGPATVQGLAVAALLAAAFFAAIVGSSSWRSARLWTAIATAGIVLLASEQRHDAFFSVGLDGLVFAWAAATWIDA